MSFTPATREAAALAVAARGDYVSLHTADPDVTGTNEATGGSPAYARLQTVWAGGAADGQVVGTEVTFNLPTGTFTHFGVWTAATGGTFVGGAPLSSPVTLASDGEVRFTPTLTANNA